MGELKDITNEVIRQEIEKFIEKPEERQRIIDLFAQTSPQMQVIAAALIHGDNTTVDRLTTEALDAGI